LHALRPRAPRQARSRATRARILNAAVELAEKQGFDRTSMAQIARTAGVGMGTLYHHVPDKRTLLVEVMEEWTERLAEQRRSDLEGDAFMHGNPRDFLVGFLRAIYERAQDRNWIYVELTLLAHRDPELRKHFMGLRSAGADRLAAVLEVGQRRGLLRKRIDCRGAAMLLGNALELLTVHMHLLQRPGQDAERMFRELTEMICSYLVEDA